MNTKPNSESENQAFRRLGINRPWSELSLGEKLTVIVGMVIVIGSAYVHPSIILEPILRLVGLL